jgi:NAD-dependent deacetylase
MTVIEQAVAALQKANKVVFFTGAGISAESGFATYNEKLPGIWAGHAARSLETAKAFKENPPLFGGGICGGGNGYLKQCPITRIHQ